MSVAPPLSFQPLSWKILGWMTLPFPMRYPWTSCKGSSRKLKIFCTVTIEFAPSATSSIHSGDFADYDVSELPSKMFDVLAPPDGSLVTCPALDPILREQYNVGDFFSSDKDKLGSLLLSQRAFRRQCHLHALPVADASDPDYVQPRVPMCGRCWRSLKTKPKKLEPPLISIANGLFHGELPEDLCGASRIDLKAVTPGYLGGSTGYVKYFSTATTRLRGPEQLAAPFFREGAQPQDHAETIKHIVSSTAATIFATVRFHVNMRKNTPSYGEVQASIFKAVLLKKKLPPNVTALTPELCSRNAPLPPPSLTATTPARTRELRSEEGPFSSNGQFNLPHQTSVTSTTMAPTRELCSGNGPLSPSSLAATTTAPTRELCSGNGPLFLNYTSIEVSDSELRRTPGNLAYRRPIQGN